MTANDDSTTVRRFIRVPDADLEAMGEPLTLAVDALPAAIREEAFAAAEMTAIRMTAGMPHIEMPQLTEEEAREITRRLSPPPAYCPHCGKDLKG